MKNWKKCESLITADKGRAGCLWRNMTREIFLQVKRRRFGKEGGVSAGVEVGGLMVMYVR